MLVTSKLLVMGFQRNSSPSPSSFDGKYFSSTGAKVGKHPYAYKNLFPILARFIVLKLLSSLHQIVFVNKKFVKLKRLELEPKSLFANKNK
jgi:hypothetical protein